MDDGKLKTILIVTIHFPPMRGGVETMNWQYLDFIETQKHLRAVVLTYDTRYKEKFDDYWQQSAVLRIKIAKRMVEFMTGLKTGPNSGINSLHVKIAYILLHLYYLTKGAILFYNKIKNADVILANGGFVETLFGYLVSIVIRKKLLIRWRTDFRIFLTNQLNNFVLKSCLKRARIIGVNGKDIEDDIYEFLGNKKQFKVFSAKQTVDTKFFRRIFPDSARNALQLPPDKFIILYAAALIEEKFCDLIVNSAYKVLHSSPSFFFIFIGTGPSEEMVLKLKDSFKQNILFIDHFIDPETLSLYINASDITVGSADVYYPGNFILESLACGTPVLIFDRSIHKEKRKENLKFEIPLPHIFIAHYSNNDSLIDTFLSNNKKMIQAVKNNCELANIAAEYVFQNYEKYKVLKEEFKKLL
jgi:glycosyltransferase involved in cell wall biosynthesis